MIADTAVERLAAAAFAIADAEPARSARRRAASHVWIAATVPPARSLAAVRRAIESFGDQATRRDALALLDELATAVASSTIEELSA